MNVSRAASVQVGQEVHGREQSCRLALEQNEKILLEGRMSAAESEMSSSRLVQADC